MALVSIHYWFASDEVRSLLSSNGLCDLDSALRLGDSLDDRLHEVRASRHDFKRVVSQAISSPAGSTTVYIKRQWRRVRWIPRVTDVRHRIGLKCSPIHEWRGLRILHTAGFDVAEPLALFWNGWGFSQGAIVTRAVPPQSSIADLLVRGELQAMADERRRSLIQAAVAVVARLHRERISWRSMKAKHFYPEEVTPSRWRIWLIDCEGVCQKASRHDCQREWRTYLQFVSKLAPTLEDHFRLAYTSATNA